MFNFLSSGLLRQLQAERTALSKSQAIIEFKPDGTIVTANENFLNAMGYTLAEIQGRHHSMFVEPSAKDSAGYRNFWAALGRGEYQAAEYKRIGKGGKEVWIQASYNPILDRRGRVVKVVKYATDVTQRKLENADYVGQMNAISKSMAVIQFRPDGTIITVNENFLNAMGYTLAEIQGRHHSMFVEPSVKDSAEYRNFWAALGRGEYQAAEYRRIGKGGKEVWIQASYNPVLDLNGKPFKVVKYATDVTQQVTARRKIEAAQKIISENLETIDHAITDANHQSTTVAASSGQTTNNVQSVAAGAEELNASVKEIANTMVKSKAETDGAYDRIVAADEATQRLAQAAQAMGGIVDLIQNIAGQINLLALNATIESARAGEAGRGFAVVANEVKNLAKQAADATDQISKEIEGIQAVSTDVVGALGTIKKSIDTVRNYVAGTASAVEEQSAVAQEMSANMQQAAQAVETITSSIKEIARATQHADESAKKVREASRSLAA
jgi:methyl-accepting chemotaxis protein